LLPLPLVLEPTARYLLTALPIGGGLIFMVGYLVWNGRRDGWEKFGIKQWLLCAGLAGLGVMLLVQPVGWRLTLDRQGITLSAPLDYFADSGTIRWEELRSIGFGSTGGRSPQPTVKFVSWNGTTVSLTNLDGVPDGYWAALAATVKANAPGFHFYPDADRWLADVRSTAQPTSGSLPGWSFTARDGEGRAIK
jgi:hypothetical protein